MWPRIKFNPMKLFNLHICDLLIQDPYFVSLTMEDTYPQLGDDLFLGLLNVPDVVAYFCEACPQRAGWLREGIQRVRPKSTDQVRAAEVKVLEASYPWNLGMVKAPEIWDALPWSYWDPSEIYDRVEVKDKVVLDVGAGTGQVSLRCAPYARQVWALEPVARLRRYIERKMDAMGFTHVQTLCGVLERVPLEDASVDAAILSNGSFGWNPKKELQELERVTKGGGTILMLGPCSSDNDEILSMIRGVDGYEEFDFEVPCDGKKPGFIRQRG